MFRTITDQDEIDERSSTYKHINSQVVATCHNMGERMDKITEINRRCMKLYQVPVKGNPTFCPHCGHVLVYSRKSNAL